jgi:hypothetical protein
LAPDLAGNQIARKKMGCRITWRSCVLLLLVPLGRSVG